MKVILVQGPADGNDLRQSSRPSALAFLVGNLVGTLLRWHGHLECGPVGDALMLPLGLARGQVGRLAVHVKSARW
jgi:hypothetical protein